MINLYSNSTCLFNEQEIIERECIIQQCVSIIKEKWIANNKAIRFVRVETPILTPSVVLQNHMDVGFPLIKTDNHMILRPEIAGGCFNAFLSIFPQESQRNAVVPICIWQAGKSFREENNSGSMRSSRLRLKEFWQLEFELIVPKSTKCNYISDAIDCLISRFEGEKVTVPENDLPHYSELTLDWEIDGIEVAGCSIRKDLPGFMVHEVSIGLDRLLKIVLDK